MTSLRIVLALSLAFFGLALGRTPKPSPDCPTLTFTEDITELNGYEGQNSKCNGTTGSFESESWDEKIKQGDEMMLGFDIDFDEQTTNMPPDVISAKLKGKGNASEEYDLCLQAPPPKSTTEPFVPTTQPEVPTTQPDAPTTQPEVPTTTIINPTDMQVLSVGDDSKTCNESWSIDASYPHGYVGTLYLDSPVNVTGWVARVKMSESFTSLSVFNGHNETCSGKVCYFYSNEWDAELIAGQKLALDFQVNYECGKPRPDVACLKVNGGVMCGHDDDDDDDTSTQTPPASLQQDESILVQDEYYLAPEKDCNNSWSIDNPYPNGYVGRLYLKSPVNITGWVGRVKMSQPFTTLSIFNG